MSKNRFAILYVLIFVAIIAGSFMNLFKETIYNENGSKEFLYFTTWNCSVDLFWGLKFYCWSMVLDTALLTILLLIKNLRLWDTAMYVIGLLFAYFLLSLCILMWSSFAYFKSQNLEFDPAALLYSIVFVCLVNVFYRDMEQNNSLNAEVNFKDIFIKKS